MVDQPSLSYSEVSDFSLRNSLEPPLKLIEDPQSNNKVSFGFEESINKSSASKLEDITKGANATSYPQKLIRVPFKEVLKNEENAEDGRSVISE
jgi:hypothetical protein